MHTIPKEKHVYSMSFHNQPVLTIKPGEKACFQIYDCFENQFDSPDSKYEGIDWNRINPATGPVYIEGADPGDTLVVHIEKIKLDSKGVIFSGPNDIFKETIECNTIKRVEIKGNFAVFNNKVNVPLNPMIGVIGTAPKEELVSNGVPGNHGGNMDCKEIKEGTTLYLPVYVPGALLAIGDLHAAMGDGEATSGIEVAGDVTVTLELIKRSICNNPMAVTADKIMFIASSDLVDDAIRKAVNGLAEWLEKELEIDLMEASMLLSILGDIKICQVVNPLKTVRMELPKWVINQYGHEI